MSQASMTAGVVGKFGQSSFTSVSGLNKGDNSANKMPPKPSKFFKSRNATLAVTEAIQEEDEEEAEQEESNVTENETVVEASFKTPGTKNARSEDNIVVGIRVRPLREEEENVVELADTQVVVASEKVFNFDLMFGSEVGQETVYRQLVEERVQAALDGFNATVFAYGQTGTGKTFSMGTSNSEDMLDDEGRGVITRALQQVFTQLKEKQDDYQFLTVKISFLEITKEQVYDLLNPSKARVPLQVRELHPGSFGVVQLTEIEVSSMTEAMNLLHTGGRLRTTEATAVNQNSSRSHAVFSISLVSADPEGNTITRKLNLVDLAGSESLSKTGAVGSRFEEAKKINLGLTVLNRVITGLSKRQGHIPYRDSVLTKVLKESLEAHCYISMLACISPSSGDVQETVNTLRFSNEAKHLKTKPLPASLLDSCRASAAKKREAGLGIPSTPLNRGNNTIHGLTPGKTSSVQNKRPAFNRTIGTPGKRAKMEQSYVRGREVARGNPLTSTVSKNILTESLCDISAVEPSQGASSSVSTAPSAHDMTGLLSPLMRTIRENMQEEFEKLKSDLIKSKAASKTPQITKRSRSRATSSPNKTIMTLQDMVEETDLLPSHIEVTGAEKENFISGLGMSFPHPPRSVNPRFRAVMESASPELVRNPEPLLPLYESPASSSSSGRVEDAPRSPTIEEMERTLGINPNSPSLMFSVPPPDPNGTVMKKSRKSSRRTTLMGSDLNETLKEIQNFANSNRRRSVRTAAKGIFYGSPSQMRSDKENPEGTESEESPHLRHPLLENERKMDPAKQIKHNQTILDFVNVGNTKQLGGLPAVGPKTAFLIHQHRGLHGCFENLRQLETIPGLNKNFFKKFCKQNQIDGLEDCVTE